MSCLANVDLTRVYDSSRSMLRLASYLSTGCSSEAGVAGASSDTSEVFSVFSSVSTSALDSVVPSSVQSLLGFDRSLERPYCF